MDRPKSKRTTLFLWLKRGLSIFFLTSLLSIIAGSISTHENKSTRTYGRSPSNQKLWSAQSFGFAPNPEEYTDAVIQVYAARTWGAKKAFAVHTWVATKHVGASGYVVSQVIGWRLRRSSTALFSEEGIPDKSWYGNPPELLLDLRGEEAEHLIERIEKAVQSYPYSNQYRAWPGPNSNTFTAWIGLQVPELGLDLPSTAIGKDYRPIHQIIGRSSSGTGLQASIFGLAGLSIGYEEGLEINILGLNFEFDVFDLSIEIPGYGRIGKNPVENTLK